MKTDPAAPLPAQSRLTAEQIANIDAIQRRVLNERPGPVPRSVLEGLSERARKSMRLFLDSLFFDKYEWGITDYTDTFRKNFFGYYNGTEGRYFHVPNLDFPYPLRISVDTGGYFPLKDDKRRYPIRGSNPFNLWLIRYHPDSLEWIKNDLAPVCRDGAVLWKAAREMEEHLDKLEDPRYLARRNPEEAKEEARRYASDAARFVYYALLEESNNGEFNFKGNAQLLREGITEALSDEKRMVRLVEEGKLSCDDLDRMVEHLDRELRSRRTFSKQLHEWCRVTEEGKAWYFDVTLGGRKRREIFTITLISSEERVRRMASPDRRKIVRA